MIGLRRTLPDPFGLSAAGATSQWRASPC